VRVAPSPPLVDWTLLSLVLVLIATGLLTALAGVPADAWVFVVHGVSALLFAVFLIWKFKRVAHRLRPANHEPGTWTSVVTSGLALVALGTGIAWTWGAPVWIAGLSWLTVHAIVGVLLAPALLVHLQYRYRGLRRADISGRRTALRYVVVTGIGGIVWWVQETIVGILWSARRFTGSRERGSLAGTSMPVTMWAADDPEPIDVEEWGLTIDGAVDSSTSLSYDQLDTSGELRATLDCTSGWYSIQDWRGHRVGDLLAARGVKAGARWVRFVSVTGYRWSLPIEEAEEALLATHVSGDRLDHGHGYPLRLVAPGRRGFQWVKWVQRVEVRRHPDPWQWAVIFTSGFE
jgi:DMSO/TMAO reductase YedYZ molybdopterin-dependent catalytic subunit